MRNLILSLIGVICLAVVASAQSDQRSSLSDSFGRVNCGDVQARTDAFLAELSNDPNAGGLIDVTPDAANPVEAFVTLQEIAAHLRARRFNESRMDILISPARTEMSIQFWKELPGDTSQRPEPAGTRAEIEPPQGLRAIKFGSSVHQDGPTCGENAYDLDVFALAVSQIQAVKARVTIRAKNTARAKKFTGEVREQLRQRGVNGPKLRFVNVKSMAEGVELWLEPSTEAAEEYRARRSAMRDVEKYGADINRHPEDPDAYILRARAYKTLDRLDEAVADLTRAIELSKHAYYTTQATADRGEVYMKRGEHSKAIADFTAVIRTTGADAYKPKAYLSRGEANLANGDRDAALADADAAIKLYTASKLSGKVKGLAAARKLRSEILSSKGPK